MIKRIPSLGVFFIVLAIVVAGCADETDPSLDYIKVIPESLEVQLNSAPRQFYAWGYYDDDSTKDLTEESTWSDDSSGDSLVSTDIPGRVYFREAGYFAIIATYTIASTDLSNTENSNDSDDDSSTDNEFKAYSEITITE